LKDLQLHLHKLQSWNTNWRIKINKNKFVHATFTLKRNDTPPVYLNNLQIPKKNSAKYIGFILDRRLITYEAQSNKNAKR